MKKFLLFFTLVVCVVFKAEAKENVIKNPYHLFQNRFKGNCVVTRTDTTTVFTLVLHRNAVMPASCRASRRSLK